MIRIFNAAILALLLLPSLASAQPAQWTTSSGGNGHWYQVVTTPTTISWNDASAAASAMMQDGLPGYLVTITSPQENDWILSHLTMGDVWTGAIQSPGAVEPLGGWGWITDEPWTFSNWCSGEPANTGGNEDRLTITYSWPRCPGGWNDASQNNVCSGFLVEWSAEVVGTEHRSWGAVKATYGVAGR